MKIAISGAQGVGKTTVINVLENDKKFTVFKNVVRNIASRGNKINDDGDIDTQCRVLESHLSNLDKDGDCIYDRCLWDWFVFTTYLYCHDQINEGEFRVFKNIFKNNINRYDLIFYIPPEFDLVDDGVRSMNEEFREEIVNLFEEVANLYGLNYFEVRGTVEERINFIVNVIREKKLYSLHDLYYNK